MNLDPKSVWEPWQPTAANPFDRRWAGHLFRRAAFGASRVELDTAVRAGLPATLDRLFTGGPGTEAFDNLLDAAGPDGRVVMQNRDDPTCGLADWWLHRLLHSPHPLREKLTLFWHNHFATSITKVLLPGLMKQQNQLLRRHAFGKFPDLLRDICRDPAMLVWLDGNSNRKELPNENFAREFLELFTLGLGHYSEQDVRESARAFTGWHTNIDNGALRPGVQLYGNPDFTFAREQHDYGPKTILGQTGPFDGKDVQRLALEHSACARFLVRKFYRQFISEEGEPADAVIEPLANRYRASGYDTADLLRTMLSSRLFFSDVAFRRRVKGPVEFVGGLVRLFGPAAASTMFPARTLEALGQALFAPPSVKGWDGGPAWLNATTLLARINLATKLINGTAGVSYPGGELFRSLDGETPDGQVRGVLDVFLQPADNELGLEARQLLAEQLSDDRRLLTLASAIVQLPLYQLA